ncbi:MAG: bifunctional nuclease family protein [Crenarchaeota archaeon]|nr:bifunctional nuclease family protein [Thermoproteota archaeon]
MVEKVGGGKPSESGKDQYGRARLIDVIDYIDGEKAIILFSVEGWGDYVLPICIDATMAFSIKKALENINFPRPLTHDLLVTILDKLDATIEKVTIDAMIDNIYVATIYLRDNRTGELFHIDARPSDATALAVRVGAPIYIAHHLKKYAYPYSIYRKLRGARVEIEEEEENEEE